MRAAALVGLLWGWLGTASGTTAAGDDVLDARLASCREARDGECLLRLAAFEEAAEAFERGARWERAAHVRAQLGQIDRAYADALAFAAASADVPAKQALASDTLALAEMLTADGQDTKLAGFYRRYLRDFGPFAAKDSVLVAHAKLGAALLAQSCPIRAFHGACVEIHREARNCPNLCDEHGNCPGPIFKRTKPDSTTYSVEIAVRRPRDPRLLREARYHLRLVADSRDLAAAETLAATSPDRTRALANAKAEVVLAGALPDLDRFLGLGGVPEDLDYAMPTQWDSPCAAMRKRAANEYSSRRFIRWMREKLALMDGLRTTYVRAATSSGPETAVAATALYSFVMQSTGRALLEPDDRLHRCPVAGHIDGTGNWWVEDIDLAASLCERLANRYAIDTPQSRYCRIDLAERPTAFAWRPCGSYPHRPCRPGANPGSSHLLMDISPNSWFMDHSRDEQAAPSFRVTMAPAPPRDKPKPPRVPCSKTSTDPGVLKMHDGADLARFFSAGPHFPPALPDQLAARFPPPFTK